SSHSVDLAVSPGMITLEPALLVVSCERIKQELLRELNMQDHWRGKIFIVLRPARTANDPIEIAAVRFAGNWNCSLEVPHAVDRDRFIEAIVRVLLLEIGDRNAGRTSTEIPEWMAQGFARQLLGSSELRLILPPPNAVENGFNVRRVRVDVTDNPTDMGPNT